MTRLFSVGLFLAACVCIALLGGSTSRSYAQKGPPPVFDDWITIDVETKTDAEFSHVQLEYLEDLHAAKVCIDCTAAISGKVKVSMYDNDAQDWVWMVIEINEEWVTEAPVGTGASTKYYFIYPIDATSQWGQLVANGSEGVEIEAFLYSWDLTTILAADSKTIYKSP